MSNPITDAQALEAEGKLAEAIQAYDDILNTTDETPTLALANFSTRCYLSRSGGNSSPRNGFSRKRINLIQAIPTSEMRVAELNQHFSENREAVADEMSRKNSDQIVSLFRIATGIKLLTMDETCPSLSRY